jgi:rSAM/selenodomain-associated transferase 1
MSFEFLEPGKPVDVVSGRCALGVMIKAPRPRFSKTRLCPPLQPEEAAQLSRLFLKDTAENIALVCRADARTAGVAIYTPIGSEAEFVGAVPDNFYFIPQRGAGFGERLLNALEDLFAVGFSSVALIDSDSPSLPTAFYQKLVEQLSGADDKQVVIGPTEDGGYYLIGVTKPHDALFTNINWSTEEVFGQTVQKAAAHGLRINALPEWYDVDDAVSLGRLTQELLDEAPTPHNHSYYPAPSTAAFLRKMAFGNR